MMPPSFVVVVSLLVFVPIGIAIGFFLIKYLENRKK